MAGPPTVSICIPHYNRSRHLLAVLESIRGQDHPCEVVVSDDCSTDDSACVVPAYIEEVGEGGRVRFRYLRRERNGGYDVNLRASMAAALGDYLLLLGNDDALRGPDAVSRFVAALKRLGRPDVLFTDFVMHAGDGSVVRRADGTKVLGSGPEVATEWFRSFSFVGGVAMKRTAFLEHDTDSHDRSVFVQIYLAARIVAAGGVLASVADALVAKDVVVPGESAGSYADTLVADNQRFVRRTGGLDQVGKVACDAILPFVPLRYRARVARRIFSQILVRSYAYWLMDYRGKGAFRAARNLAAGCVPVRLTGPAGVQWSVGFSLLPLYAAATVAGLLLPVRWLRIAKEVVLGLARRRREAAGGA